MIMEGSSEFGLDPSAGRKMIAIILISTAAMLGMVIVPSFFEPKNYYQKRNEFFEENKELFVKIEAGYHSVTYMPVDEVGVLDELPDYYEDVMANKKPVLRNNKVVGYTF